MPRNKPRKGAKGKELMVRLGALAPSISEQVGGLSRVAAVRLQENADAITRLSLHNLLTDGEATKARGRLVRSIRAALTQGASPNEH